MTSIDIQGMSYVYSSGKGVFENFGLTIASGEFVVLVGPSGCGKSTLLRLLSGLAQVNKGRILFNSEDVTHIPARKRNVSMVFQSYALYPHMNVRRNLELSLRIAGVKRAERQQRVQEIAKYLEIDALLERRPAALSGGQRQRVAMGRALVRKPAAYFFDEPLSNLDAELRARLRVQMKKLHQAFPSTKVYVTHDQVEAMTLADRIVVLRDGVVQQAGAPDELYASPANLFVGQFLGSPALNVLSLGQLAAQTPMPMQLARWVGEQVGVSSLLVGFRPEQTVILSADAQVRGHSAVANQPVDSLDREHYALVPATVEVAENLGSVVHYTLETPCGTIRSAVPTTARDHSSVAAGVPETPGEVSLSSVTPGFLSRLPRERDAVFIAIPWSAALFFQERSGLRVRVPFVLH
jgi:ABC-type sugar transport system ATPase subunit